MKAPSIFAVPPPHDAAGIAKVYLAGWHEAHAGLVPAEYLTCMRAKGREDFWRTELEVEATDRKPWVALIDDGRRGLRQRGPVARRGRGRGIGEVYQVYVEPGCWGRGIGEGLLRHVLRDLREHGFDARGHVGRGGERRGARASWRSRAGRLDGATRAEECGDAQVEQVRYSRALR